MIVPDLENARRPPQRTGCGKVPPGDVAEPFSACCSGRSGRPCDPATVPWCPCRRRAQEAGAQTPAEATQRPAPPGRTGLPLPRFVTLRANEVNLRSGPGTRYPIDWVYRRSGMPVEIIDEFDTWRRIRDWQGTEGWVHQSMVQGRRGIW